VFWDQLPRRVLLLVARKILKMNTTNKKPQDLLKGKDITSAPLRNKNQKDFIEMCCF